MDDTGLTAAAVAERFGLEPLALEGGRWSQSWRDEHCSAIYFLLEPGRFSALHRLTVTELWHHYAGAPASLLLLDEPGRAGAAVAGRVERVTLGHDLGAGHHPMVPVTAGRWMGAATTGDWTLVGTTVAPPFEPSHFELGDRDQLIERFPDVTDEILALTHRPGSEPAGTM